MAVAAYGYFSPLTDWNTNTRLAMVKAVVEEKRFEIDSFHDMKGLETNDKAGFQGHFYSDKAIGSSLIGIVFYRIISSVQYRLWGIQFIENVRVFKELNTFFAISLMCAFLAPLLYSFAKKISKNPVFSLLVTAAICFGTPFYKYAALYYGHNLAGLFLFVAFFIWFSMRDEAQINLPKVLISGYLLGYAIIVEYPTVIVAFLIGLYILYILWKKRCLADLRIYACLAVSGFIPIAIAMTYNYAIFGNPLTTGYSYEVMPEFIEGQSGGFMGIGMPNLNTLFYMTFHTTMGIFWQSPILLLAFIGWFRMWQVRQYRAEVVLSLSIILLYFLLMSGYYLWWGGRASSVRSLIPVLPFFAIPLIFLIKKPEKILMVVLALVSIAQMFMVTAAKSFGLDPIVDTMLSTSFTSMFQHWIVYEVYVPNFFAEYMEPNRGQEFFRTDGFISLIPLLIIEVCALVAFFMVTVKRDNRPEQEPRVESP